LSPILGIIASQNYVRIPPSSYESIATATPSGVSTITFSSIPSTYASLQLRISSIMANSINLRPNNDTSSIYTRHRLYGNGTTVTADGATGLTQAGLTGGAGGDASTPFAIITDILDYSSTTKTKTIRTFSGRDLNGTGSINLLSNLWNSTAAITSLTIVSAGNFGTGATFSLYGIK
jgi:hypothetical protein